jgi:outer membrane protein insertion porin family
MVNGEIGYADGYRNKPLPFFKNFYAGGVGSVRAFETASLGPRDLNGDVLGGNRRFVANFEALFPLPATRRRTCAWRSSRRGQRLGRDEKVSGADLRVSVGPGGQLGLARGPAALFLRHPVKQAGR